MSRSDVDFFQSIDGKLAVVKFMDTKPVHLVSNTISPSLSSVKLRKQKGSAEKVPTDIPQMVIEYNAGMGGVDKSDQMKGTYEFDRRARIKYYLRVYHDIMDTAMVNAWILHCMLQKDARGLVGAFVSRKYASPSSTVKRRVTGPSTNPTLPQPTHLPEYSPDRKRCKICTANSMNNRSYIACDTCGNHYCLSANRNCFKSHVNNL